MLQYILKSQVESDSDQRIEYSLFYCMTNTPSLN